MNDSVRIVPPLRREIDGALAILTLDRPEKRNALSIELRYALAEALSALAADDAVRCAVLTGAGSAFCAGMDVTQFGGDRAHRERLLESSARCFDAVARFPKPLVAYVNGPALAGGFALALLCDLRLAAPEARMGFPEIGRHIPPSYAAARAALPEALARELCLTGRILDAAEAERRGVVSAVASRDEALEVARGIAAAPAAATGAVKRRALLHGERTWLPLLQQELDELRAALLG
ncbi:MAG TPA: enoyl-CoA hydratase/isomerase family protein [Solirubrobacteraceae bacterium]|nr:enoyl-CoA hydratase/isomerase family protein [Solirubrobacteraceae bacterium]